MTQLNLPDYQHKTKKEGEKDFIFDPIRKKYILLTPEEWVRQNIVQYLIKEKNYPIGRFGIECSLTLNTLKKRCDIIIYDSKGQALLIIECKAPNITINQKVFDQIIRYNIKFRVQYLFVSNGMEHFCCKINFDTNESKFLKEIPDYNYL